MGLFDWLIRKKSKKRRGLVPLEHLLDGTTKMHEVEEIERYGAWDQSWSKVMILDETWRGPQIFPTNIISWINELD